MKAILLLSSEAVKDACQLTPAEYEIAEILWVAEVPCSVSEVLDILISRRPVAYTTVMTLLDKMARKGSLSRTKQGKAFLYRPRVRREDVLDRLIEDFTAAYFAGNRDQLASCLNGSLNGHPAKTGGQDGAPSTVAEIDVALL